MDKEVLSILNGSYMGDKLKWVVMTQTINKLDRFRFITLIQPSINRWRLYDMNLFNPNPNGLFHVVIMSGC